MEMLGDKTYEKHVPSSEINWDTLLLEANLPDFKDILDNEPEQLRLKLSPMMISWLIYWSPHCSNGDVVGVDGGDLHKQSQTHTDVDKYGPIAKKQKRQLRNRDAVVRSRKRKKMYVKDLEMKSRYFEGECRRLSHMLQCFIAENQAL
ncbi:hypothetical protein Gogos_019687 [Gossypium gossypioides]|uniref:BZIP domain-containing protein n=1 Tax=Gossypium gossypioides TaxID=34282 RepID=A0A7J9BI67_GOSGO|nr:hypothetical protein [Gossypium gossypioides]